MKQIKPYYQRKKTHRNRKIFWLGLLLSFGGMLFSTATKVQAQLRSDVALDVSPGVQVIQLKPGETKLHTITITQNGDLALEVIPHLIDISSDNESGQPILLDNTSVKFVSIENSDIDFNSTFSLPPHTSKEITLRISPSNQTSLQEYPLAVMFQTTPKQVLTRSGASSKTFANIASNLIIDVALAPPSFDGLQVKEIEIKQVVDSFRSLDFKVLITNQANYSIPIHGRVTIADWSGEVKHTFHLTNDIVLGNSNRLARNAPVANEEFTNQNTNFIYNPSFLIGPYTIRVELLDPNQNNQVFYSSTKTVLAIPISILVAVLAGLSTYIGYMVLSTRNRHLARY